jgi:hypothetical protein
MIGTKIAAPTLLMMARIGLTGLFFASTACSGGSAILSKENSMTSEVTSSASRVSQPALPPITFEGKRYQQIMNGEREGLGQRTGLMAVTDLVSGKRVAVVKVYDFPRDPGLEADAGDVFFKMFTIDAARREIVIDNERRQRFAYGIDTGIVRLVDQGH